MALPFITKRQYRFPKSKKKRIQDKWRFNPANYKEVKVEAYQWGKALIVSLEMYNKMVEKTLTSNYVKSYQPKDID